MIGDKDGSLILKFLRDDRDFGLSEHFFRVDDRIESPEAGIVGINSLGSHAPIDERVFQARRVTPAH